MLDRPPGVEFLLPVPHIYEPSCHAPSFCTHAKTAALSKCDHSEEQSFFRNCRAGGPQAKMDLHEATPEVDKIHLNRLSVVTEDEEEQDAALTIVTVLDKVANIVDNVQASQKRIEERHREMEDAIKSIQIDILKLAQAHANTSFTVNKLLDKTRKVSSNVKDVKARVDKQSGHVQKVESKQEELLRKNKFRVVIFQVCPKFQALCYVCIMTEQEEM